MTNRFDADTVARLSARASEPDWLRAARAEAFARSEALPWPDQTREEWRHTDLRALDVDAFDPEPAVRASVGGLDELPAEVRALAIGQKGDRLGLIVQIDADVVHQRLSPGLAEKGVIFAPLARAAAEHPELVRDHLGRAGVSDFEEKIASFGHAFASGGTFLYVPRGIAIELPIQSVRWIDTAGIAVCPRVVIVADEGSEVTYIEHAASAGLEGASLALSTVEIYAEQGAQVSYLGLQDHDQSVWSFEVRRALVGRDATVRSLAATFGAGVSRSVVQAVLEGRGAHGELLGVYFGDHAQHIDNRTLQLHRGEDTSSNLFYKGALKGSSRAIYSGLVDIEKDALRSDAQQANRNMLLSPDASADPSPFLEIKTSEVTRATHGVSVGRPDENVLFYLQSRGLDAADAERVYVEGFFQEIIDRVRVPHIRETLEAAVQAELEIDDQERV